jgi:diguanylate cyclase (GGDEF)-like protein/PAS domain S-box-containing protein
MEAVSTQVAIAAERNDMNAIRGALRVVLKRNEDVLSAALRGPNDRLMVAAGDHRLLWDPEQAKNSRTHASLPLFKRGKLWGSIEIRFAEPDRGNLLQQIWSRPALRIILLVAVIGFLAYLFYLKRTLRYLDPSSVIPARVQATLDVMAEGVVLLGQDSRVVLANSTLAEWLGRTPQSLLGDDADFLGFEHPEDAAGAALPWTTAIRDSAALKAVPLILRPESGEPRSVLVNCAPVLDGWDRAKGAIATFDDVTELEHRSRELATALTEIEKRQYEIEMQNQELEVLATRDPLTGVANRRSFLDAFTLQFAEAKRERKQLCCIMADIDFFKKVNDTHGHAMGDEVIKRVSEALVAAVRGADQVCRYGGEEFCIALPDTPIEAAVSVAERIRASIASPGFARTPITSSFGVSSIAFGPAKPNDLINQADEALYASKEGGRNRVTRYDQRG